MESRREERRLVTCLFIDIVGSTELTMRLGPERLKRSLGDAFERISEIVSAQGGTVEKYIGDAIYALFGAPIAHPDDPDRAIRTARACLDLSREHADFLHFLIRIGVETGEAVVDLTAAEQSKQQMSVGVCVNIAARLQQQAESGQILVGPTCHEATSEAADYRSLGELELKGVGRLPVWSLEALRAPVGRRRLPFVGREAELELLHFAHRRSRARSVLALVSGPPGQGKTRLVDEFVASLDGGANVLVARCRPAGEVGGLAPLQQLLGISSASEIEKLRDLFDDDDVWRRMRVALAHSAGLETNAALASLGPDEREDELVNAWRRYVSALARRGPTILWIEDVHWAEPLVVRLLDRLTLGGDPLLAIATARPEFAEAAGLRPSGDRFFVELSGLEREAGLALARSAGDIDARVVERAEGNPLFIVELARARSAAELPLTLQGALGARLDELSSDDRALLACAAVAGESFTMRDASALAQREAATTQRALGRLVDLHYVQAIDDGYRFHHSLLRDVAYGRLLVAERMKLHARYARELARPDDGEVRAYHWWLALRPPEAEWVWERDPDLQAMRGEALGAHLDAAAKHTDHFAVARAIELLERARAFVQSDEDTARLEFAIGLAYARDIRGDQAWEHYERALEAFDRGTGVPMQLLLEMMEIRRRWGGFHVQPSEERMRTIFERGEEQARSAGDMASLARVLMHRSVHDPNRRASLALGGRAADEAMLKQAVSVAEASGDASALRDALGWLANHLIASGDMVGATTALDRAMAVSADAPRTVRLDQLLGRCQIAFWSGQLAEGRRQAAEAVALSRPMGPHLRTHATNWVSLFEAASGTWPVAIDLADQTARLIASNSPTQFCAAAAGVLSRGAVAHALAGRGEEARALIRTSDSITIRRDTLEVNKALALSLLGVREVALPENPVDTVRANRLVAALVLGRWDIARDELAHMRELGLNGAPFARALTDAADEELRAATAAGPTPEHSGLKAIGYLGWSQMLARRRTSLASAAPSSSA